MSFNQVNKMRWVLVKENIISRDNVKFSVDFLFVTVCGCN